jgi:uncharacterized protein involved in cysteine biosynthesis
MIDPGQRVGQAANATSGIRLFFEGYRLLRRERSLWGLATVPTLLAVAAVSGAVWLVYSNAAGLHDGVTAWMPLLEVEAWYAWLWLGPSKLALALLGYILFLLAAGLAMVAAFLLANVASAPFLDALSERVEQIATGAAGPGASWNLRALLGEGQRALVNELQRALFFGAVWGGIFLLGIVIPGGQLVAPPLLVVLTMLFLPLDYASYTLDRRQISFRQRREWVSSHSGVMLGFGATAFLSCLIPGLNFLMIPVFVTSGTLLALRFPPNGLTPPALPGEVHGVS